MSITKQGIATASYLTEFIASTFDTNTYVEPDGSAWIRIFHHNDPASALFASTDTFTSQVYKDENRWFNVAICNLLSDSWELMVKQALTSGATEYKYRWIQTINPMEGKYSDVVAANITKITTTGYSVVSGAGGLYKYSNSNTNNYTYLVIANSSSGNWFGAMGAWVAHSDGIPGYPNSVVTSGYMDLYLRIDAKANLNLTSIDKNFIKTKSFNEI